MAFFDRDYEVYIICGSPEIPPLWQHDQWSLFAAVFDPLVLSTRGSPALRCGQYRPNGQYFKHQTFGKLGWNEKSHLKWMHGVPNSVVNANTWKFGHIEFWAPNWNVCVRDNLAPDVYFSIINEKMGRAYSRSAAFNPICVFAGAVDLGDDYLQIFRSKMLQIGNEVDAKLIAFKRLPWGVSSGGRGFTNAICDASGWIKFNAELLHPHETTDFSNALDSSWLRL